VSPHSFRRTFENVLRKAGVDDLVRRSLAGWSTEEAQSIYATVDPEDRMAAGRRIVDLVLGAPATPAATPEASKHERPAGSDVQRGVI
jgi:hypothetical protein